MIDENPTTFVDNDLVRRTRSGDLSAFEQIFARHHKRIYNIALQMLGNESDASDITQEVFVMAFRSISSLKSDAAFATWLKMITVNVCRDALRKRGRVRIESLDMPRDDNEKSTQREIADWTDNPERALDKKETQRAVQKAICSLTPQYREAVVLYYLDGSDVTNIARILKCPEGTIKSRLARARAELKRKLAHLVNGIGETG